MKNDKVNETLLKIRNLLESLDLRKNPAPRIGTANALRNSQRVRTTKAGVSTKKPSPRLKARRVANSKKGYFPNPVKQKILVQSLNGETWRKVAEYPDTALGIKKAKIFAKNLSAADNCSARVTRK